MNKLSKFPGKGKWLIVLLGCWVMVCFGQYATGQSTDNQYRLNTADSLAKNNHPEAALYLYKQALLLGKEAKDTMRIVQANIGIAGLYRLKGNYYHANDIFYHALRYCRKTDSTSEYVAFLYHRIAMNFGYMAKYDSSMVNYDKAIAIYQQNTRNRLTTLESIYNNKAALYSTMLMPHKALDQLSKIDTAYTRRYHLINHMSWLCNNAHAYALLKQNEKSKSFLLAVIPLAKQEQDNNFLFYVYLSLAQMALNVPDTNEAWLYIEHLMMIDNVEPAMYLRRFYIVAQYYMVENKYKYAIEEYKKLISYSDSIQSRTNYMVLAYRGLSLAYAKSGNHDKAYLALQNATTLNDSIKVEEQRKNIAALEALYNNAQKDKELAEKEFRINRQESGLTLRNVLVSLSMVIILILTILLWVIRKNHLNKQNIKDEKMQLLFKEKGLNEMKALMDGEEQERTRIARDIHDGLMIQFSMVKMNLASVLNKNDEASPYLVQLDQAIASLRRTAHNLMPDALLEGGLAEAIYYFCENVKEYVAFELTFHLLDDIPRFEEKFELSVYRIVQELIQNIIKHAQAREAYIQMGYQDGLLNITIEDDGIGIENAEVTKEGLGLKSISNRIPALDGTMEIAGEEGRGTSIILEFVVTEMLRVKSEEELKDKSEKQ